MWVAWVKILCGLHGLCGSKYLLCESTFYVGRNFSVGCVGQVFLRGLHGSNILLQGSIIFLHGSAFIY